MALSLSDGSNGAIGKQMLDTVKGITDSAYTSKDVAGSVTGLSHAHEVADQATTRLTGKWSTGTIRSGADKGGKANAQWILALQRGIQNGYYNPARSNKNPIALRGKGGIAKENIEKPYQNQILPFYKKISKKNEDGLITKVNWTDSKHISFYRPP